MENARRMDIERHCRNWESLTFWITKALKTSDASEVDGHGQEKESSTWKMTGGKGLDLQLGRLGEDKSPGVPFLEGSQRHQLGVHLCC